MAQQQQSNCLRIISYNMRGFNQGCIALDDIIADFSPNILFLQEHWLTPANLNKFDRYSDFFSFGRSAMTDAVDAGLLKGRPYGGVLMLIDNNLRNITETIYCSDRFCISKVANHLLVNIYLPCSGTKDRLIIIDDLLTEIASWLSLYPSLNYFIAGDLNVDLDCNDSAAQRVNNFISNLSLSRCDLLTGKAKCATYIDVSLNHHSTIDYMLTSASNSLMDFDVIDPDINYSDHLPLLATILYNVQDKANCNLRASSNNNVSQLRWDHADLISYYHYTGVQLQPILDELNNVVDLWNANSECCEYIASVDKLYNDIVNVLRLCARSFVPERRKNFYKFWWNEELKILKEESINSNRLWKSAGKPRRGSLFNNRQRCRMQYRKRIRECQRESTVSYSNDLNDALMQKHGTDFWKCWNSKFEVNNQKCEQVDGYTDSESIAAKFASHFETAYSSVSVSRAQELETEYLNLRKDYSGYPLTNENLFDVELVSKVITDLKRGKAAGLDLLSAEHLQYCHPILPTILTKLFNLMLLCGHVPKSFGRSYTVPIPKIKDCRTKALTTDDFRGIAISAILSKVYELCIYNRFSSYLKTDDNQFGFKKGSGCTQAIYTVRKIIEDIVQGGATANLCAIDLSKAFDKTDHHALFIKLMERNLPIELLATFENWFNNCWTCVRWRECTSAFFQVHLGVRQGSVLAPYLFAIYVNDIVGNYQIGQRFFVILYADDILLISSSVCGLRDLLHSCERELSFLNMAINAKKSCCLRIGPQCDAICANIITSSGSVLPWSNEIRYLGIFIVKFHIFKCCLQYAKRAFYRSLNAIFGKVGRIASEEVLLELVSKKCFPILLYSLESCPLNNSQKRSLDFPVVRFLMKLFKTSNNNIVNECRLFFNFLLPSEVLVKRTEKFMLKYASNM